MFTAQTEYMGWVPLGNLQTMSNEIIEVQWPPSIDQHVGMEAIQYIQIIPLRSATHSPPLQFETDNQQVVLKCSKPQHHQ